MTKSQLLNRYINDVITSQKVQQINDMSDWLCKHECITTGFAHITHNPYQSYHYEKLDKMLQIKFNNYGQPKPLKRIKKWDIEYHLNKLENELENMFNELCEQMILPFEQTQKQTLK